MIGIIILAACILLIVVVTFSLARINSTPETHDPFVIHDYVITDSKTGKVSKHYILIRESERKKILLTGEMGKYAHAFRDVAEYPERRMIKLGQPLSPKPPASPPPPSKN